MLKLSLSLCLLTWGALASPAFAQQVITYKCASCGGYHTKVVSDPTGVTTQPAVASPRVVAKPVMPAPSTAQPAGASANKSSDESAQSASPARASVSAPASPRVVTSSSTVVSESPSWNFHNANRWRRQIDPRAQAWAQEEANRLARRGYSGYLQNGHPGGNNPYGRVTGTGTTFPGATLIHTCEGDDGMTLVAEAAAVSHDGRIYGVRSWR